MKILLYTILCFCLILSCRKNSTVTIQAQNINNTSDGSAYAGMEYYVVETWIPYLESKSERIASGTLDANGKAVFDVKMKPSRGTVVNVSQPDNICYGSISQSLEHQVSNTVNFEYATCGMLDIKSNNINCEGTSDEFRFRYYYSDDPDVYIYTGFGYLTGWNPQVNISGCKDYSTVNIYHSRPAGSYTLEWQVIRPSGTTNGSDNFTVTENDTTTYVLEY